MRVGLSIDALSPELTGIGRYCWELASRLPESAECELVEFYRGMHRIADPADLLRPPSKPVRTKTGWRPRMARLGRRLGLRRQLTSPPSMAGLDVFHGPNFMLPAWVDGGIATIHDLSVIRYPETHPADRIAMFKREFARSLGRTAHIITDSRTVRDEVMAYTGFPADRITAVPLGVGESFRPVDREERDDTLRQLGLPLTGYGLSISTLEPRKRIGELLVAWGLLPAALRKAVPLVIAGASGWRNAPLHDAIARGAAEGWVIPLGFVSEDQLPALYNGAALFAYPSRYEGFGLPPLEAMACGVPVIVANASCLPEVTAGAAMLIEPDDIDAFAASIQHALQDESWRREAIEQGLEVAGGYTWDRCIERTVQVYCGVVRGSS